MNVSRALKHLLSLILVFSREQLNILKLFILETLWNLNKQTVLHLIKILLLVNKWQVFVVNFRLAGAFCILGLDC